jgi:hypothetical protein
MVSTGIVFDAPVNSMIYTPYRMIIPPYHPTQPYLVTGITIENLAISGISAGISRVAARLLRAVPL